MDAALQYSGSGRLCAVHRERHSSVVEIDKKAVGRRIVEAYTAAGMNRHQFMKALGTTYSNVMRWEEGETTPKGGYLQQIAVLCKVDVEWILEGESSIQDPILKSFLASEGASLSPSLRSELAGMSRRRGRFQSARKIKLVLANLEDAFEDTSGPTPDEAGFLTEDPSERDADR
jgi:transcriptional regulator with XRE-family HTH domain